MRVDVDVCAHDIQQQLEIVHGRLSQHGATHTQLKLAAMQGLRLRLRKADGEYYVYVEDEVHDRLAGYIVFNRLIEVSRRADRHLRSPHAKILTDYQRRGISSLVYRMVLERGVCLVSGARQSAAAHALWRSLARHYLLGYVDVRDKAVSWLGTSVDRQRFDDLNTRMLLLGKGWTLRDLASAIGLSQPSDSLAWDWGP